MTVTKEWNPNQKKLSKLLSRAVTFGEAIDLCLMMHNQLHDLSYKSGGLTIFQRLLNGLPDKLIRYRPKNQFSSIAWNIWHITRIEDAVINVLIENDRKRKPSQKQLHRIVSEKVVTNEEDSKWLVEFWSRKNIGGLLTMPITRHQIVHINDSFKIKTKHLKKFG